MLCKSYRKIGFGTFLLGFVFVSFFFCCLSTTDVSAASVDCSVSFTDITSSQSYDFLSNCDTSSLDSSSDWYYFVSFSSDSLVVDRNVTSYLCFSDAIISSCSTSSSSSFVVYRVLSNFLSFTPSFYGSTRFSYFRISPNTGSLVYTGTLTFSFSIYDSIESDCPVCEECQVCPAIPENPYDDKFDKIIVAIYTCAAVALVLYFFYCIYGMIIKATGGKE